MKVILTENQIKKIKNKLINESYDSEYGEYGELIDIKFNILVEKAEDGETYEEYRLIEFNTIKGEKFTPNEVCDYMDLCNYFGDDVAYEMDSYKRDKENFVKEYTDEYGYVVTEYSCYLTLNNMDDLRNGDVNDFLKKVYGTTEYFESAIWLLEDGTLLNGDEGNGYRTVDHNSIEGTLQMSCDDAMDMGIIRLMPESPGFEVHRLPSYEQENMLSKFIKHFSDETIYVDFGNGVYSTYKSPHHYSKILSDIEDYFTDGVKPLKIN